MNSKWIQDQETKMKVASNMHDTLVKLDESLEHKGFDAMQRRGILEIYMAMLTEHYKDVAKLHDSIRSLSIMVAIICIIAAFYFLGMIITDFILNS